jgi:hypothetical protein
MRRIKRLKKTENKIKIKDKCQQNMENKQEMHIPTLEKVEEKVGGTQNEEFPVR